MDRPAGTRPAAPTPAVPGVDDEELTRYLQRLRAAHCDLPVAGFETRVRLPIRLDQVYVPLRARVYRPVLESEHKEYGTSQELAGEVEDDRDLAFDDALREAGRYGLRGAVVLGDPGSGKTTLLKHFVLAVTDPALGPATLGLPQETIPVFIELRRLRRPDAGLKPTWLPAATPATEAISGSAGTFTSSTCKISPKRWPGASSPAGTARWSRRPSPIARPRWPQPWRRRRPRSGGEDLQPGGPPHLESPPPGHQPADAPDPLSGPSRSQDPAGEAGGALSGMRSGVTRAVAACQGDASRLRRRGGLRLLQPLAYWLHVAERKEAQLEEILPHLEEPLRALRRRPEEGEELLRAIRDQSGVLVSLGQGAYAFLHLSFQEYLCARHI